MLVNPGGTFMYSVWNQWQEEILPDGHELVFDSDIWFRRFLYLPDDSTVEVAPYAYFVYTGASNVYDQTMTIDLLAGARDLDLLGDGEEIVEYEWTVDGVLVSPTYLDDSGRHYNAPPRTLSNGWHGFSVRAKDNEGHWSKAATHSILLVEDLSVPYRLFLPLLLRP